MRTIKIGLVCVVLAVMAGLVQSAAGQDRNVNDVQTQEFPFYLGYVTEAAVIQGNVMEYAKSLQIVSEISAKVVDGTFTPEQGREAYRQVSGKLETMAIHVGQRIGRFPLPPPFQTPEYANMASEAWKYVRGLAGSMTKIRGQTLKLYELALKGKATKDLVRQVTFSTMANLLARETKFVKAQKLAHTDKEPVYHLLDMTKNLNSIIIMTMWWVKMDRMPVEKRPEASKDPTAKANRMIEKFLKGARVSLKKGYETAANVDATLVKKLKDRKGSVTPDFLRLGKDLRKSFMSSMSVQEQLFDALSAKHAQGMSALYDFVFDDEFQSLTEQLNVLDQDRQERVMSFQDIDQGT